MPQLCTKCSRANPAEAIYCHYDGFVLGGHERRGGPVSVGSQPFNSPFVFPNGRTCRSFDELALACQDEWAAACELLRDGYLETFFGGLGRVDLARAAKEAAKFPDVERGLDQLLEKVPSTVLAEPKLRVDPVEVSLGVLDSTKERKFELELENTGGRLLYGTASSPDSAWISLGEVGSTEKHFQFTSEQKIIVLVRPANVRASNKPIEAKILIESNGGTIPVILKAEKPVKPFPHGPFKGAKTPRQVAEVALKAAKEVGPLFEAGEVERWYETNGWIYPVKTPAASGLAAVQQFFEALGLTKPPKVEISEREFLLSADPGEKIPLSLEVTTAEKKAVWAHATSNVPWLEVSRPKTEGRKAVVAMSIPSVPDRPGETLEGELTVIGNGNVRWLVPVRLSIGGELPAAAMLDEEPPAAVFDFAAPEPPRPKSKPEVQLEPPSRPKSKPEITEEPPRRAPPPPPITSPRRKQQGGSPLVHLVPAALLAMAVLCVVVIDLFGFGKRKDDVVEGGPGGAAIEGWNYDPKQLLTPDPRIGVQFSQENRFGIIQLDDKDPANKDAAKKLTFAEDGTTNNTSVKIAGHEYVFGQLSPGISTWEPRTKIRHELPGHRKGYIAKMYYPQHKVLVTQHVEIVPGRSKVLDTCLVYYSIYNRGDVPQKIGIRVMLDTYIGRNDGVPFLVPGRKGFVDDKEDLERGKKGVGIPDYLEVVENPDDPNNPGTTARLGLGSIKLPGIDLVDPTKVRICRYPGRYARWEWDAQSIKPNAQEGEKEGDSAVAIYWPEEELPSKKARHYAFTYGLGELDVGLLKLSVPSSVLPTREFIVTCYVYNAQKGERVSLNLPKGLAFSSGDVAEKKVEETAARTAVFWRVKASSDGEYKVTAESQRAGKSKEVKVVVKAVGLFG